MPLAFATANLTDHPDTSSVLLVAAKALGLLLIVAVIVGVVLLVGALVLRWLFTEKDGRR